MERIVEAALQVGLDRLTMRRVAAQLGVGASTLYHHVESQAELSALIGDHLLRALRLELAEPRAWEDVLRRGARELRRIFERAPGFARQALSDPRWSDTVMQANEEACAFLAQAGLAPPSAWLAVRSIADFVESFVLRAQAWRQAGGSELDHIVRSSDADDFPVLHAAGRALGPDAVEQRFTFGLECLIRGLRSIVGDDRRSQIRG